MSKKFHVAIVGATGAVGEQIIQVLEERKFPVGKISFLASSRSAGSKLRFAGSEKVVQELTDKSFDGVDIALFSAGGSVSEQFAPAAVKAGAVVIDNTNAFRMDPEVPLVVPEVNPEAIADYKAKGIIANPNCSTIQMVVALKPLHDAVPIRRVVVSTYQSVSGAGRRAMKELADQSIAVFNLVDYEKNVFPHRIAFNCLPQIDSFMANGYTKEEMKMIRETRKIMKDDSLRITATTVRVPVFSCHGESINIEFTGPMEPDQAREIFSKAPGIVVKDDPEEKVYPIGSEAVGTNDTYVGRIRKDESLEYGLNLWCLADNLRKGAAGNAVQIAELLAQKHL